MSSRISISATITLGLAMFGFLCTSATAQETTPAPTGITPAVIADKMSDEEVLAKVSYVIGYNTMRKVMDDMKRQAGLELNAEQVAAGAKTAVGGADLGITKEELDKINEAMQGVVQRSRERMIAKLKADAETNKVASEAFMAENAKKEGVMKLENGVQYTVMQAGSGVTPGAQDQVKINYHGMTVDGKVFDSSVVAINGKQPAPITHSASGFVPGFNSAIQKMKVGEKWKVVIPSDLAYGMRGPMGPNQALIFEIELLDVIKAPEPPAGG